MPDFPDCDIGLIVQANLHFFCVQMLAQTDETLARLELSEKRIQLEYRGNA